MGVGRGRFAGLGRRGDQALRLGVGVGAGLAGSGLGTGLGLGGAILGLTDAVLGLGAKSRGLLLQPAFVILAELGLDGGAQCILVDAGRRSGIGSRGDRGGDAGARVLQIALEILDPQAQVGVLVLKLAQRVLDEVEELVDLVLVVAALANRRLAERDVVHISWSQRHGEFPFKICGRCNFTGAARLAWPGTRT